MRFRTGVLLFALCFSAASAADLKTLVEAKETSSAFMSLPTSDNGRLTFKSCEECDYVSVRLTPATQFYLRGKAMTFADFRRSFSNMRRSREDYALVTFDTEAKTVSSVRVAD